MTYDEVSRWAKLSDLINNRVKVINQVLGAHYVSNVLNPCRVTYARGSYSCEVCGHEYATWGVCDLDGIETAYDRIDSLADGVWLLVGSGRLAFSWDSN